MEKLGMDESEFELSDHRFAIDFQENLAENLQLEIARQASKRTPPATEVILDSLLTATVDAVAAQSTSLKETVTIEISAHKSTELMREKLAERQNRDNVIISGCQGSDLDFQARIGSKVIVNAESELHGSRARADDLKKLVNHEENPPVSVMVWRAKSKKEFDRIRKNIIADGRPLGDSLISVGLYWKDGAPLNEAKLIIDGKDSD
jgi:hypothetical protein